MKEPKGVTENKKAEGRGCSNKPCDPGASISPRGSDKIDGPTEFHPAKGYVENPFLATRQVLTGLPELVSASILDIVAAQRHTTFVPWASNTAVVGYKPSCGIDFCHLPWA